VLIVDDVPFNRIALQQLIESNYKLQSAEACDGQEAIDVMVGAADKSCCAGFRVVFMDIEMPVKNGVQASIEIKQLVKSGIIKPVIIAALTCYVREKENCFEAGMDYFCKLIQADNFSDKTAATRDAEVDYQGSVQRCLNAVIE